MIDSRLFVFIDDNNSFTDFTYEAFDFSRDTFTHTFTSSEDALYVGFTKPINAFYTEIATANTNSGVITTQYFNGTSFVDVTGYRDDTKGFNRSGFITWDRNLLNEAKTTINSQEAYWYKAEISADTTEVVFDGLNMVLSDDSDLKSEFFEILDFLPSGQTSHILSHVASRNQIISEMRRDGRYKVDASTGLIQNPNVFDILDFSEVRIASTFLTLSKIFSSVSDRADDKYKEQSDRYMSLFNKAMDQVYLAFDRDNDGKLDNQERYLNNTTVLLRR